MQCDSCQSFINPQHLSNHLRSRHHKNYCVTSLASNVFNVATAFQKRVATYRLIPEEDYLNIIDFFTSENIKICDLIQKQLDEMVTLKINLELYGLYTIEAKKLSEIKSFCTENKIVTRGTSLEDMLIEFRDEIHQKMEAFAEKDSGL